MAAAGDNLRNNKYFAAYTVNKAVYALFLILV